MLKYGWPDNFDRERCRSAMLEREQEKLRQKYNELTGGPLAQNT
jgi:hypothetical protein